MTRDDDAPAEPRVSAAHVPRADDGGQAADALVAEAARLADAFTSWVGGVGGVGGTDTAGNDDPADDGAERDRSSAADGSASHASAADGPAGAGSQPSVACDCGRTAGLDTICRVCPVCRIAAYMHTVRPEVLVRVADVLAMVAGSLQVIAADRTAEPRPGAGPAPRDPSDDSTWRPDPRPSETGVPIPVRGDDDPTGPERH